MKDLEAKLRKRPSGLFGILEEDEEEIEEDEINLIEPGSEEERQGIIEAKATTLALKVSITVVSLVIMALGAVWAPERVSFEIGALTGLLTGLFFFWHMDKSLKSVLNMDELSASSAMRKDSLIRLGVLIVVDSIVMILVKGYSPIGVLFELLALKISVYLAPVFTNRVKKYVS